jgi:hypothetical protein
MSDTYYGTFDKAHETRVRRKAKRLNHYLHKQRGFCNGYILQDERGQVVVYNSNGYGAPLVEVEEYLDGVKQ